MRHCGCSRNVRPTANWSEPFPAPITQWAWFGPSQTQSPLAGTGIVAVLPRTSELSRKRAFEDSSEAQVLAANIDVVGVVVPVDRPLIHNRLERTLVAAWDSGAVPLVTTLINALAGWKVQSTGAVRAVDGRGRHTTTSREPVPLPGGAVLMDTPGRTH